MGPVAKLYPYPAVVSLVRTNSNAFPIRNGFLTRTILQLTIVFDVLFITSQNSRDRISYYKIYRVEPSAETAQYAMDQSW